VDSYGAQKHHLDREDEVMFGHDYEVVLLRNTRDRHTHPSRPRESGSTLYNGCVISYCGTVIIELVVVCTWTMDASLCITEKDGKLDTIFLHTFRPYGI
jgi:hypothetical protein